MHRWRQVLSELPLAVGVGMGWLWLWLAGKAFVLDGMMEGYGWSGYVMNAWSIDRRMAESYDYFRAPLHGWLLGMLGEGLASYADAAIVLSSLCVAGMVVFAGLAGRAMVGPWVGGLAAAALPLTANTTHAVRWANSYPVMAATTGGSLALSLCLARWPHPLLALLAGAMTGLAWAADGRGLIALPPALLLCGLAARHAQGWRRGLIPLALLVGLLSGPGVRAAVDWDAGQVPTLSEKLHTQREVVQRWIDLSADDALMADCGALETDRLLTGGYLKTDCPAAMIDYNLRRRLPRHLPLSGAAALLGLLAILPGGRGRRGAVEGSAVLLSGASMLALFALTPMADRYLIQFAVLVTILGPIGLGRLIHTAAPERWRVGLCAAAMLALGGWAWQIDPASRRLPTALQSNAEKAALDRFRVQVAARVGDQTPFLDCSNQHLALAMLPRIPQKGFQFLNFPLLRIDDAAPCLSWIRDPPAQDALIAIEHQRQLRLGMGGSERVMLSQTLADSERWTLLLQEGRVQVWGLAAQ